MTQLRVSDLVCGKIDLFGLHTLVNMAVAAGMSNGRDGVSEWIESSYIRTARLKAPLA